MLLFLQYNVYGKGAWTLEIWIFIIIHQNLQEVASIYELRRG